MILGWKVDDALTGEIVIQVGFAEPHLLAFAARRIVVEHCGEAPLELGRDTLAHHPDAIDGIDQGLRLGLE